MNTLDEVPAEFVLLAVFAVLGTLVELALLAALLPNKEPPLVEGALLPNKEPVFDEAAFVGVLVLIVFSGGLLNSPVAFVLLAGTINPLLLVADVWPVVAAVLGLLANKLLVGGVLAVLLVVGAC